MNTMSLNAKLWLSLAIMWLSLVALGGYNAVEVRHTMVRDREAMLDSVLDAAVGIVAGYQALATSGALPVEEAQKRALGEIFKMKYGDNGYFYISDTRPFMLMHPIRPELVGKDASNLRDPRGNQTTVMSAQLAKAQGRGFVDIFFPRPGGTEPVLKRVGVRYIKPWDWVINTGLYMDDIEAAFRRNLRTHALFALVLGLLSSGVMLALMRNIKRGLGGEPAYAAEVAERIAAGDLSQPVRVAGSNQASMLAAMSQMQAQLQDVISRISRSAESVSVGARQIAVGSSDLSQRTESAASSLEETASSMEEMNVTVRQNADSAMQATQMAATAAESADKGREAVRQVGAAMQLIEADSNKVADITGVIESIAFQTNLLSLNAAVEAARAGEHGRGFAVVASEVRALAQRCATASTEIKRLTQSSVGAVREGSALVQQAGETMAQVVTEAQRVTDIVKEIAAASTEQSRGIAQVNEAITQMDAATQQNAALVEETASAASSLNQHAQELRDAAARFRV